MILSADDQAELWQEGTINRTYFTGRLGVIIIKSAIYKEKRKIPVDGNIDDINVILSIY
jgi:hypothetical protein